MLQNLLPMRLLSDLSSPLNTTPQYGQSSSWQDKKPGRHIAGGIM